MPNCYANTDLMV